MLKKTLVTPPQDAESSEPLYPISIQELKDWQIIEHDDDDDLALALIASSTDLFQLYTGRYLIEQVWSFWFDCLPEGELVVDGAYDVLSVEEMAFVASDGISTAIATEDAILLSYYIDKHSIEFRISPKTAWPQIRQSGYNNFSVNLKLGYGLPENVPPAAKTSLKLLAGHLYKNREATAPIGLSEVPLGIKYHMDPFRVRLL